MFKITSLFVSYLSRLIWSSRACLLCCYSMTMLQITGVSALLHFCIFISASVSIRLVINVSKISQLTLLLLLADPLTAG